MPDTTQLRIYVGGSALDTGLDNLQPWRPLLHNADAIGLVRNGTERVRVQLGGQRRWIAFRRTLGGCPLCVIGYQVSVGRLSRADEILGGSNRKVLAWLFPDGAITVGNGPLE